MDKLFAVAVSAFKPDPEHEIAELPGGGVSTRAPCSCWRGGAVYNNSYAFGPTYRRAETKEQAEAEVLEGYKQTCPPAEGWTLHRAEAVEIDEGLIMELALEFATATPAEDEEATDYAM